MAQQQDKAAGSDVQHPGDDAKPGTSGTGENVCPVCKGTKTIGGAPCENCGGTGVIIEGIGGG